MRAALYDARARLIDGTMARVACHFTTTADGGAEADANDYVAAVEQVIGDAIFKAALDENEQDANIAAIGISCFWHSIVGVNAGGETLTPLYGWADTRASSEVEFLRAEFDETMTHNRTGCRFHASYWTAKLRWLKRTQPEVFTNVKRWMPFDELLMLRLCDESLTSVSMASGTGLLDVRRAMWDAELGRAVNVKLNQLPTLADAKQSSRLNKKYRARWKVLADAKIFPAIGDGAANTLGAGYTTRNQIALMIGTSGAMRTLYRDAPPARLPASAWCYRLDRERVVVGGAFSDGGGLYEWLMKTLRVEDETKGNSDDEKEINRQLETRIANMDADAHGLTILPFWSGERSTGWTTSARGAILGLTMDTEPHEIVRAAMEAVAYRFRVLLDALDEFAPAAQIYAAGGALQASAVWTQILADVLNRPIALSAADEASCRGAALLALETLGVIQDTMAEAQTIHVERAFAPNPVTREAYDAGLRRQTLVYELLTVDKKIAAEICQAVRTSTSSSAASSPRQT